MSGLTVLLPTATTSRVNLTPSANIFTCHSIIERVLEMDVLWDSNTSTAGNSCDGIYHFFFLKKGFHQSGSRKICQNPFKTLPRVACVTAKQIVYVGNEKIWITRWPKSLTGSKLRLSSLWTEKKGPTWVKKLVHTLENWIISMSNHVFPKFCKIVTSCWKLNRPFKSLTGEVIENLTA